LIAIAAAAGVLWLGAARADLPSPGPLAEPAPMNQVGMPHELFALVVPGDDPVTAAKVALGKQLFFDGRISADGTVACATCHNPDKGFTDQLPTSMGINKQFGKRNAPTVLNAAFNATQFWDGRAPTLEDQAKLPILNPIEMGRHSPEEVVTAVASIPEYQTAFREVFGRPVNYDDLARAISSYERTQPAFDSRFDKFIAGDEGALSPEERRGWSLFNGKGRCMTCHAVNGISPLFTDNRFHNIGVAAHKQDFTELARKGRAAIEGKTGKEAQEAIDHLALETDLTELGRFLVTRQSGDIGNFKTSGLRNLLVTQPYFHDGSAVTLWDVMDHYNKGGVQNPYLDGGIQRLGLTEAEIDDVVAFLGSLTSRRYEEMAQAEMAHQRERSRTERPSRDTSAATGELAKGPGLTGPFGDVAPDPTKKDPASIGGR
jgi:cytochrome c peroxidase